MRSGSNVLSAEELKKYLDPIDGADEEIANLREAFKADCEPANETIRDTLVLAKADGVNLKALRTLVAGRRAERKQASRIARLEPDAHAEYTAMVDALGDFGSTPLGAAALDRARPAKGRDHDETALDTLGAG